MCSKGVTFGLIPRRPRDKSGDILWFTQAVDPLPFTNIVQLVC